MEAAIVFLLCAAAAVSGQMLTPYSTMGMGTGWGNQMWSSGMRYPGVMQTSQLNSMTYPTWRNHPLFRMSPIMTEKKVDSGSEIINVPKVPSSQEVLTHMALASQNPKPYVDTIADFLYEPQKARAVVTPVATVATLPVASVASMPASPVYVQGMNVMRTSANMAEDCGPDGTRWVRGLDWLY